MIEIKSFAKKTNKNTNSGSGSNTVIAASTDSKVLDTHLLWGNEFNGTQDVNGSITSTGNVTAVNGSFSNNVSADSITADSGNITTVSGTTSTYTTVNGTTGNINTVNSDKVDTTNLEADSGTVTTLSSTTATVTNISGTEANYTTYRGTNGYIDNVVSESVDTTDLNSETGSIVTLTGDSITYNEADLKRLLSENITTENLTVTKSAHFFELIIDKIKSAGGSVLLTPADGFKVDRIDNANFFEPKINLLRSNWKETQWVNTYGKIGYNTFYSCSTEDKEKIKVGEYFTISGTATDTKTEHVIYLLCTSNGSGNTVIGGKTVESPKVKLLWQATDGEKAISNMWKVGDQAICETFNNATVGTSYDVSNKYYWALVSEVGTETIDNTDYHYITLDGGVVDGTLNPEVGDEIAMLGYRGTDDSSRQSALYVAAYNSIDKNLTAPLIAQYEGIDDFDLSSHKTTWFAHNGNEVKGNLKVIVDGNTKTVQELVEDEKQSILSITDERITAAVTEAKTYTDGKETTLRSYIDTTAANVLLSANNTSKDYTDGMATTLRGEISVSADEITSTVSKKIGGSNLFLGNTSNSGWKTTNTTYPKVFYNDNLELFYTLTQYYDIFSPVIKTNTISTDYVISLYGGGTYYLAVYGFDEGEDFNTLSNWNSAHQIFNATSTNLTLLSGDTFNGLTRRYKTFNTNKKYLGIRITLVTAGNGTTTGSRIARIQVEEGTTPLAYNTGSSAISSQITQTAEQIIVDVKDLLINGDVTINGLITNVSGHINQQDLEDKDAVVIDFVNNKNITVENILDGVPLQLRNNGQIVYLPFYDSNYNDNLSGYVSQNPVVTASEFGFTKYGLHFEDSAINFTVPTYKVEGTQLRITNSYVPTINNWQNYANIYSNVTDSEKVGLFGQLLRSCVILCADPRLLTYRNYRGYYNSSLDGMIFDTSKGQQTSTTNVIDPSHSGAFLYNGLRSRFIFLLPSQSVNLRSQIINYGNGRKVLNWLVESTSDIKPIAAAIAFRYGNDSEYTTYYNEVIGGTSWQTQYTQVNDIMLGHDAINGDKLGTRPVYPIIQITNNTIANGSVPYVIGYEEMQ